MNANPFTGLPSHFIEERQDGIFRKVRGILNKITPETFDKLSKELINVGLDSPRTLRGVIYLLFDKALKDLKYSSLYAKLCQELSEKAPNFEQEPGPNTFCKFLISKCEDEFERRRKATEDFDGKSELSDEEYELKAIAKQKMLGNIKFICELGKKRLLQEEILHECIRGLLSKKKERPLQDQAQDLECLCQIMRTIGCLLDIQASKNLMNQYFDRIDMFSKKPELPYRIRFMLRDVIDLRNNNWRPRPFQREDNVPQPLSKLREEAGYDPNVASTIDKFGNSKSLIGISDLSKLHSNKISMLLDDEPSFTTTTDFHWGPTILPFDQPFDAFASSNNQVRSAAPSQIASHASKISPPNISTTQASPFARTLQPSMMHHNDSLPEISSIRFDKQAAANSLAKDLNSRRVEMKRHNDSGLNFFAGDRRAPLATESQNLTNMRNDRDSFSNMNLRNINNNNNSSSNNNNNNSNNNVNNNNTRQHANIIDSPPMMLRRDDHSPASDRRFADIKTNHFSRGGTSSPPMRPINRLIESSHLQTNQLHHQPPPTHFGLNNLNSRSEMNARQAPEDHNENRRRIIRSDIQEPDGRYNRSSNFNNYRQPRLHRPPQRDQHYFERSQVPESELNLNWRKGPSLSAANPSPIAAPATPAPVPNPAPIPPPVPFSVPRPAPVPIQIPVPVPTPTPAIARARVPPTPVPARALSTSRAPPARVTTRAPISGSTHDNTSSNSTIKESKVAPLLSPLFSKPPTRVMYTNFSLRPSHNLAGRTTSTATGSTQREKMTGGDSSIRSTNDLNKDVFSKSAKLNLNSTADAQKQSNEATNGDNQEKNHNSQDNSPIKLAARDLHVKKFNSVILELSDEVQVNISRITGKIKDLKIPKCYQQDCLASAIRQFIPKPEDDRDRIRKLFASSIPSVFDTSSLVEAFKLIFEQLHALEIEIPRVKSIVAEFLSHAVLNGLVALDELGNLLSGGKHHPLFLLFLQRLDKSAGQTWLSEKFIASKINLMEMLPEIDRSKDRLANILKDRCLGFLDPVLTIEPDLWDQMKECESTPAAIYRWIKDNIEPTIQGSPTFAHVFITCLLKYINETVNEKSKNMETREESEGSQSSKSSPSSSTQGNSEVEKELLGKYQQVLQAIMKDKQMQLAALHSLQTFYYNLDFPKGALLRWFHMLYDMNIVDDDVFFIWKEEINDGVPGKGQALFQVNTWLNWLAEDDSDEEEEV